MWGFKFHSSVIVGTGNRSACRWLKEFIAYSINSFPSPHTTSEEGMVEGGRERWRVLDLSSRPPPPSFLPPIVTPSSIELLDDLPAKKCAPKAFFDLIFAFGGGRKAAATSVVCPHGGVNFAGHAAITPVMRRRCRNRPSKISMWCLVCVLVPGFADDIESSSSSQLTIR